MLSRFSRITILLSIYVCSNNFAHSSDDQPKYTPDQQLIIASFQLDMESVRSLLKNGANPNARLGFNDKFLFQDKRLLSYSHVASDKWTPLMAVANSRRAPQPSKPTENTIEARDRAREKLKAIDPKIIQERDKRRVAIAKLLIAKKVRLDHDDGYGATALDSAIYKGFDSLSLFLIESGANPNTKTGIYIDGPGDITPLHQATKSPKVLKALLKHDAKVAVKDSRGDTPLHWAVRYRNFESVRLLIVAGADVDARDNDGHTPYYSISSPDNKEEKKIAKLMRAAGAK